MTTKIYRAAARIFGDKFEFSTLSTLMGEEGEYKAIRLWTNKTRAEAEHDLNRGGGWFLVEVLWDEDNEKVIATG